MSSVLITFCNSLPQGFAVACCDFDADNFDWLSVPENVGPIGGATGICRADNRFFVLLQHRVPGWPGTLAVYDEDLQLHLSRQPPQLSDAHSMVCYNGGLFIANTGTNEIVRIGLTKVDGLPVAEPFWQRGGSRTDCDHINTACWSDDRLYVCLLGPNRDTRSDPTGAVLDAATGEPVLNGLYHPHSLTAVGEDLYCLESLKGRLWRLEKTDRGFSCRIVAELPGYLRGFAFDDRHFYIGASGRRLRSKSRGTLALPPPETLEALHCWLHRLDRVSGKVESRDLTAFGREIYDLALLQGPRTHPRPGSSQAAMIRRQLVYDREHLQTLDDLRRALEQYAALQTPSAD